MTSETNGADVSGYGHDAAMHNTSFRTGPHGVPNTAIEFEDHEYSYLEVDGTPKLDVGVGDGFTFLGQVKTDTVCDIMYWLQPEISASDSVRIYKSGDRLKIHFGKRGETGTQSKVWQDTETSTYWTWTFFAASYNRLNGEVLSYINDEAKVTTTTPVYLRTDLPVTLRMGSRPGVGVENTNYNCDGSFSCFMLFDRSLAKGDILLGRDLCDKLTGGKAAAIPGGGKSEWCCAAAW